MVRRPLESVRPFGPLVSSESEPEVENQKPEVEEQETDFSSQDNTSTDESPILKQAEDWYESIAKEENKRKMMRNYFRSVSDLSDSEIDKKLDEAGL